MAYACLCTLPCMALKGPWTPVTKTIGHKADAKRHLDLGIRPTLAERRAHMFSKHPLSTQFYRPLNARSHKSNWDRGWQWQGRTVCYDKLFSPSYQADLERGYSRAVYPTREERGGDFTHCAYCCVFVDNSSALPQEAQEKLTHHLDQTESMASKQFRFFSIVKRECPVELCAPPALPTWTISDLHPSIHRNCHGLYPQAEAFRLEASKGQLLLAHCAAQSYCFALK